MKHTIYILIALLIFIVVGCENKAKYPYKLSDFSPKLKKHIQKIIAEQQLLYKTDSLTLSYLKDSCSKEDLLKLINFENPLMRVWVYRVIIYRNEPDYFQILLNHLNDTAKVSWQYFDDASANFNVSDLMIRITESEKNLTQARKDSLIDLVLTTHNYLDVADWMLQEIEPKEKYYSIVKQKAQKKLASCHDLCNIYTLAKYRKKEDIPIIKKNFSEYTDNIYCNNNYFKAFEVFPDSAFFPLLTKYFEKVIKKQKQQTSDDLIYYCRALAEYKNQLSLNILIALTKKETYPDSWYLSQNKENVFVAIHKYNCPIYDSLYHALKPVIGNHIIENLDKPDYSEMKTW